MNSALLSISDTETTTQTGSQHVEQVSVLEEVLTLAVMLLATSSVVLLLTLHWAL